MTFQASKAASPRPHDLRGFGADRRGATAVEFGLLAVPFLGLFMALFQIGFYFFWSEQLQATVLSASRNLMTGAAQTAGVTSGAAFAKNYICNNSRFPSSFVCGNLIVDVRTLSSFSSADTSADFYKSSTTFCPGQPNQIVIVRVIYPLPAIIPIPIPSGNGVGTMQVGGTVSDVPGNAGLKQLLLGTAVFQNEPAGASSYSSPQGC